MKLEKQPEMSELEHVHACQDYKYHHIGESILRSDPPDKELSLLVNTGYKLTGTNAEWFTLSHLISTILVEQWGLAFPVPPKS